jgi:hypothetical protein
MDNLIERMQEFAAIVAVDISTVRGLPAGTLHLIRSYLKEIDLHSVPVQDALFREWLDKHTGGILDLISPKAKCRPWGTARKALNMFLRDCSYQYFLRTEHGLDQIEALLEIPLDSIVAAALREDAGRGNLPSWPGLRKLTPEISDRYQEHACKLAGERGLSPTIHLDICLWIENRPVS